MATRRANGQLLNRRLEDFIETEGPFPQRFASPLRLPHHARRHQDPEYRGESPQSIATSNMPQESSDTHGSLPTLCSIESLASASTHSSMGRRHLTERLRTLDIRPDGVLVADERPHTQPVLQCPFQCLGCPFDYSDFDDWLSHSLKHFVTGPSRLARGAATVMPPTENRCCFCSETFLSTSGFCSWHMRMVHIAHHHQIGHRLAHARPDFLLFRYLWETHLINEEDYRELKGNTADRSRLTYGVPSPPNSDPSSSPPSTPTTSQGGVVAFVNERRHDRHRRR